MCSSILGPKPRIIVMDKYEGGGDLTDIFRASTAASTTSTSTSTSTTSIGVGVGVPLFSNYNHHRHSHHVINNNNNNSCSSSSSSNPPNLLMNNNNSFGDPFLDFPHPLASAHQQLHLDDDVVPIITNNNNNNIFSNIIQISPRPPPLDSSPVAGITSNNKSVVVLNNNNNNNMPPSTDCLVDNAGLQISSPRNPTLKRRKSQAKKVVCIPAPAAANSRPSSGEVVPSDLWAWRKYGQKPIKGSPYPRGYYRCSSSKGCSARKQVERSRTDPNMLVITYTSEHNHPWPTQRNALAGSTRSQPSKNNNNNTSSIKTNNPPASESSKPKEEEDHQADHMKVKEETEDHSSDHHQKHDHHIDQVEELDELQNNNIMEDNDDNTTYNHHLHRQFSDAGLAYKPSMVECNIQSEDFFADLGEIEADPLNLLFTPPGFNNQHQHTESKALDPFHLFDWSAPDHTTSSFEDQPKT